LKTFEPTIIKHDTSGVCNYAALPGQMHITRLVYGPQLHLSSSAG